MNNWHIKHRETKELMRNYTRSTWAAFNKFQDSELDLLLMAAGVIVPSRRSAKLEAALLVWFDGIIPDIVEFRKLNVVYAEFIAEVRKIKNEQRR